MSTCSSVDDRLVVTPLGSIPWGRIRRAVESHDELLAAGKAFVEDYLGYINSDDYDLPDPRALMDAIAKAEGESDA